ncbi:hypothetical protein [Nonomuraea endophytica]|uniref:Secreted protein n=1 Tax=Nonomuraea endophytica TaxID=714136 RepID=A0A7W8A9A9_9ACTN|nr:hypothetical protein [Nonomuraea endophytica]MBB5081409.1 hypothetical protein [Nonomuraea endophytica]
MFLKRLLPLIMALAVAMIAAGVPASADPAPTVGADSTPGQTTTADTYPLVHAEPGDGCKVTDPCEAEPPTVLKKPITPQDAAACTPHSSNGYVCGKIYGTGKYINNWDAQRQPFTGLMTCDYQANLSVYAGSTRIYSQWSPRRPECSFRGWFTVDTRQSFPTGTTACISWYESDERVGRMCFNLTF